ncbi:hypothetical protein CS8_052540 [Cupriavidus sp. 8B]
MPKAYRNIKVRARSLWHQRQANPGDSCADILFPVSGLRGPRRKKKSPPGMEG